MRIINFIIPIKIKNMETKLTGKVIITGKILVKTGLHIGGSKSSLDIGGVDLNVIKTPKGLPIIPGSSLKGKLRTMLAKKEGSEDVKEDSEKIKRIFGDSGDKNRSGQFTKLMVRDAYLDEKHFKENFLGIELDYEFSEVKWENTIDRKTGKAEHPRQIERVPAGAVFNFEMVYDVYNNDYKEDIETIIESMHLLCDDYLGGHGSRGYGKILFRDVKFELRNIKEYYEAEEGKRKSVVLEFPGAKFD